MGQKFAMNPEKYAFHFKIRDNKVNIFLSCETHKKTYLSRQLLCGLSTAYRFIGRREFII